MDRINGADTIDIGGGRRGFRDENLATGSAGTEVTALHLNSVQEEILKVITSAGIVPSDQDWSQLWQALNAMGLSPQNQSRQWLAVNSITLSSPPGSPGVGDSYYIPANASGLWAGKFGQIAQWTGSSWRYFVNNNGQGLGLPDGRVFINCFGLGLIEKPALDVQSGKWNYAVAGGTPNAITASLSPAPSSLSAGMNVVVLIASENTGPATLNLNALGAIAITGSNGLLNAGDLQPGLVEFTYSGASWVWAGRQRGQLLNIRTFSAAGASTYTPTPGTRSVQVEVQGGGGGGGGAAPTGAGQVSAGSGGGGGGYSRKYITSGFSGVTITVGAGGAASAGAAGGAGGSSSFGALISATGGLGGTLGPALSPSTPSVVGGAAGGIGSGGDINIRGGYGKYAVYQTSQLGGEGGGSFFGAGASPSSGGSAGAAAENPGSAGGGGNLPASAGAAQGGSGKSGIVIVWEFS